MESYSVTNTQAQMRKGFLEFSVLLIIGSGEVYVHDILKVLKRAGLTVVEGTLYPLLSRLKRFGLVVYEWRESKAGPPRKYYKITPEGTAILTQLQNTWQSLDNTLTNLIKKYEKSN